MSEPREFRVRLPLAWTGPRRVKIQGKGLTFTLALDPMNPQLQSKILVLSDEQVAMLRQNGLSVQVSGKKPKPVTE